MSSFTSTSLPDRCATKVVDLHVCAHPESVSVSDGDVPDFIMTTTDSVLE